MQNLRTRVGMPALVLFSNVFAAIAYAGNGGPCGTGVVHVPEPAALGLLAAGVAGLLVLRKRMGRKD